MNVKPILDSDRMADTPPQTEDAEERGFVDEVDDEDLGESEELDGESGDIADEGAGHRG
jgi:hypothetical protein